MANKKHWQLTLKMLKISNVFIKKKTISGNVKYRSSRTEVFCKKDVLRNFAKFTGKHLCQRLFFNKVAGLACKFIKKESLAQVFSCEFCEISKNTFFYRTPPVGVLEIDHY